MFRAVFDKKCKTLDRFRIIGEKGKVSGSVYIPHGQEYKTISIELIPQDHPDFKKESALIANQ